MTITNDSNARPAVAILRGLRRRCPRCGTGRLYDGWYTLRERCAACQWTFDSESGSTWAFMYISTALLTGMIVVGMLLIRPDSLWIGRSVVLSIALIAIAGSLPPRKGVAIAIEYLVERKIGATSASDQMYAIAVRNTQLYLFLRLRRSKEGDVYVLWQRDDNEWDPHVSHHASGQYHHKSFRRAIFQQKRQQPNNAFRGVENLVTTGLTRNEANACNVICDPGRFDDVLEFPVSVLQPGPRPTMLSIDLTSPGVEPVMSQGDRIIAQRRFSDQEPWIVATLYNQLCT